MMHALPGTAVTVKVDGKAYMGVVVDGRYPHMYLTLDTAQGILRIPLDRIDSGAVE